MKENFSFIELSYCMLIQTLVKKLKFAMHKELMSKKPYTQLSVTLESLSCVLTHITLENQKSGNHFGCQKNIFFKIYLKIFI